jgi:hypothetical protein
MRSNIRLLGKGLDQMLEGQRSIGGSLTQRRMYRIVCLGKGEAVVETNNHRKTLRDADELVLSRLPRDIKHSNAFGRF